MIGLIRLRVFEWDFPVPEGMHPGTYQVRYTIMEDSTPDLNAYSCIQFAITVSSVCTNLNIMHHTLFCCGL